MTEREISRVVPAILTDDPKALETLVRQSETFTDYVQIDIMDGRFVPSSSITAEHLAGLEINLKWEAHLMVLQPELYLEDFQKAGAQKIIFHYEATDSPNKIISLTRNLGLEVGIAVNPETPISAILPLAGELDSVLFLAVHPGFYGAKFLPEVLDKMAAFRHARPGIEIGIDGGIKEGNIVQIVQSGADVIFVGSAIFLQPEPGVSYQHLQVLAEQGSQKRV